MSITTLSSSLVAQKQKETLDAQSLRKTVPFRDINLVNGDTIEYQGKQIKITTNAFKSLLRMLGMSQQFANKFENLFNAEAKAQFINRIKDAMASNAGGLNQVTLVLNPISKSVVAFRKDESGGISNQQFMNVAEGIIDRQGFDISNWSVDPKSGIVQINAFNPNATFDVKGLSDEVFTGGVTFKNDPIKGFQVLPYVNRMWCTNGLTTSLAEEAYTLHSLDNTSMEKFFENLNNLRKNNYAPTAFADRVRTANATPASMREMRWAHNQIKPFAGDKADNWIPLTENEVAYNKLGLENGMTSQQAAGAKTNQSVWSVLNGLTHFATHGSDLVSSNMQDADSTSMMVQAGNLFGKSQFDHENQMPDPFGANALTNSAQVGALLN